MNKTNINKIMRAKIVFGLFHSDFIQLSKKSGYNNQYEVQFDKYQDGTFSWTSRIIGDWHNNYPMRTNTTINTWKTLEGAKKNFINAYADRVR